MKTSTLRTLVVGTGFGCRIQAPALRAAGFDVVGLVGSDAARTAQRAQANGIAAAFTDLDEAITATGAVAVAIATPPDTHGPLTLAAIARGCHVICEKPFAASAAEARAMLAAAERAGVVHLVGHEFRWSPDRAMLARAVTEGRIGDPRLSNYTAFIPYLVNPAADMPSWWFDIASGGGWLGAAGSHLIDSIRMSLGEFDSLSAGLQILGPTGVGADDTFMLRFRMKNGVQGVVQQTAAAWGEPLDIVRIAGSRGTVWVKDGEIHFADATGSSILAAPPELALPALPPVSTDQRQNTAKWQMLTKVELPGYLRLCEAFRALIEGREPARAIRLPTFADGLACMEVLDAIRASAANGGALTTVRSV